MAAAKKLPPLPVVEIGGSDRVLNPRDRRPDGSIIMQCIGGPYDRRDLRIYPPFDEPVAIGNGVYELAGPVRKNGKDVLAFREWKNNDS